MVTGDAPRQPLLEREDELEKLDKSISRAAGGSGTVVLVEGPAGIGKTRLIEEAMELATRRGFLLRRARAGEMERDMPFGVVRQLFEALIQRASDEELRVWLSGSARQALTALGRAEGDGSQRGVDTLVPINGLFWLVSNLSEGQPVALIIDDAHWADAESLRFVGFLARRIVDVPVIVVLGARVGELEEPAELAPLRLESVLLRLQPLSESSVHHLIEQRVGRTPSHAFSAACLSATAGNPFLVVEILRELGPTVDVVGRAATESISQLVPEHVVRAVLFRLGRFGEDAIALARAISVLGRTPQLRYAAELAGLAPDAAGHLCDRLRYAEILAPRLPLDFVHPLVRQAIYREQSEIERSAAHRRAAEILASAGASAADIAPHLLACGPNGDQWVADNLHRAGLAAAEESAHVVAATYFERALEEPPDDPTPLLFSLGLARYETEPVRAPQIFAEVAEKTPDPQLRVDALRHLARSHLAVGNLLDAATACDMALGALAGSERETALALEAQRAFLFAGALGLEPSNVSRIEEIAAGCSGTTPGERVAGQAAALYGFARGRPMPEVTELALRFPDPPWEIGGILSSVPFAAAKVLAWGGHWAEARVQLERWLTMAYYAGSPAWISAANGFLSEVDRLAGRLPEAEAEALGSWDIAESLGRFTTFGWSALMNLAATLVARGDFDALEQVIGELDLSAGPFQVPVNPWPVEIRAYLRVAREELEGAAQDFIELGSALEERGWVNPAYPPWRQEAAEVLAKLGRTSEAVELLRVAEERAQRVAAAPAIGSVLRAHGLLEPRARSIERLQQAVTVYEASGPPHELARTLVELGAALRRSGERTVAREPLYRALELAAKSGANRLERQARDELAAAGARPRRTARVGVAALTASETKTAMMVVEGLSNKEIAERLFVTVRTVETHLTHVYEKLGIPGRRELADALRVEATRDQ